MSRKTELLITIAGDILLLSTAHVVSWRASAINASIIGWHAVFGNLLLLCFWLFLFQTFNLYESRTHIEIMNEVSNLIKALCLGVIILVAIAFIVNIDFIKAQGFIPSYIIMLISLMIWRFFWRGLVGEYFKPRRGKVLIFQNGDVFEKYEGFDVIERFKIDSLNPSISKDILETHNIDGIVIESNGKRQEEILNIMSQFAETKYEIYVSPKLYPMVYSYFLIKKVPDSPFLRIIFYPLSNWDRFLKRTMDIFLALMSLLILSPILFIISFFIKMDTPGPVLYRQKRVGFRGRKFTLFKFRSMISDAERHTGPVWAAKNDRRITRIGRILRPFRLDELPQLFNVLRGDMSFVGPRPERPHFVAYLKKEIPLYNLRLNVHPGVTGLAQVKHNYDQTLEDVKRKLEYDLEYINTISLRLDLKIFLKTVLTVLKKEGAL